MSGYKKPPGLHVYTDRHGRLRIYHRATGKALRGPLFSTEFWTDYNSANDDVQRAKPENGASKTKAGSFDALLAEYYQSSAFVTKAASTREGFRRVLETFRQEFGQMAVASVEAKHLDLIFGKIAERSPSQAKNTRKRLTRVMSLAVKWGYRPDNPVSKTERIVYVEKGFPAWTEDDIAKFRAHWPIGTKPRIAMEILLHTGLRRADAVRLGPQHIKDNWFSIATSKSRGATTINFPVHPDLAVHLAHAPKDFLVFIVTDYGKSRSEKSFTNWIIEAATAAGLPAHRSPHGLRKSACIRLAEIGCSIHQIMALTGHRNASELDTYLKEVNQRKLAQSAMDTLLSSENTAATQLANPPSRLAKT